MELEEICEIETFNNIMNFVYGERNTLSKFGVEIVFMKKGNNNKINNLIDEVRRYAYRCLMIQMEEITQHKNDDYNDKLLCKIDHLFNNDIVNDRKDIVNNNIFDYYVENDILSGHMKDDIWIIRNRTRSSKKLVSITDIEKYVGNVKDDMWDIVSDKVMIYIHVGVVFSMVGFDVYFVKIVNWINYFDFQIEKFGNTADYIPLRNVNMLMNIDFYRIYIKKLIIK